MSDAKTSSIYTEDEEEILNLTKKARVDTLKELIKEGVPTKTNN